MASVLRFDDWETTLGTGVVSTDGSGNVAVGGSSPSYKLDVTGDINASGDLLIGGTAIGNATAFTPSWANLTPGNAVESWHYVQVNELVYFTGQTTLGSTSSITGLFQFQFPAGTQLSAVGCLGGIATFLDSGSGVTNIGTLDLVSGYIRFFNYTISGSLVRFAAVSATSPFTFATGDIIRATGAVLLA